MELRPAFNGNSREVSPTPFKGGFMDKTLLVPLDNTEVSEKMIREADAWAAHLGSRVSFLHVINPNYSWGEEKKPLFEERFEKAIHSCEVKSQYEVLFRVGKPYPKILEMEEELNPLMILMAAHDHTVLERLFLGSNTDHILHHGHTPVMVYKGLSEEMENKILVPIDYTDISRELLQKADEWALWHDAKMMIMHVDEVPEYGGDSYMMESGFFRQKEQERAEEIELMEQDHELQRLQNILDSYVQEQNLQANYETFIRFGTPYVKILDMQKAHKPAMMMMAAHSHTAIGRMLMGSNTDYLVHHANCPMLIFKDKE